MSNDTHVDVWQKMIDFTIKNQIRCDADREYSIGEDGEYHFFAFSTQREIRKNEGCFGFILQEFKEKGTDLAFTPETEAYFQSVYDSPMDVAMLIKEFYKIYNEGVENECDKIEIPTDNDILRDIGRSSSVNGILIALLSDQPLNQIDNPIRCPYHEEIDCDFCARMECYRAGFAISKHLKILGLELHGNHFPEEENLESITSSFVYQQTEHNKRFERRQRNKHTDQQSGYSQYQNYSNAANHEQTQNWLNNQSYT